MDTATSTERQKCTHLSKQSGERCGNWPYRGGDGKSCHIHGGKSRKGIAHPNFRNGDRSKYVPRFMLSRYQEVINDPELHSLRSDLALYESMIADVLKGVDQGESGRHWELIVHERAEVLAAHERGDLQTATDHVNNLLQLIADGAHVRDSLRDLRELLQEGRKLKEAERKRIVDAQQTMTTEEVMALFAGILDAIRQEVHDPQELAGVSNRLARLMPAATRTLSIEAPMPSAAKVRNGR